jgi:hypothetical protein
VADGVPQEVAEQTLDQARITRRQSRLETGSHGEPFEVDGSEERGREQGDLEALAAVEPGLASGEREAGIEQSLLLRAGVEQITRDVAPCSGVCGVIGEGKLEKRAMGRQGCAHSWAM